VSVRSPKTNGHDPEGRDSALRLRRPRFAPGSPSVALQIEELAEDGRARSAGARFSLATASAAIRARVTIFQPLAGFRPIAFI
jgi:hypothetical protein